jgi:hypothetical protein
VRPRAPASVHSHCAHGFYARTLARMLDSLVRVSRRAAHDHYASVLAEARSSVPAGRIPRRAVTLPGGSHVPAAFVRPPEPTLARARRSAPPQGRRLIRRGRVWSRALPFQQFHVLFNSLSKVLFIFRSLYLCAIGLRPVFSLRRNLPPDWSCIPKQLDSSKELHTRRTAARIRGSHPLQRPVPGNLGRRPPRSILFKLQLGRPRGTPDFKFELLPLHSPLLRQSPLVSFPPLIDMLKFSGYPRLIRGQRLKVVVEGRPARATSP